MCAGRYNEMKMMNNLLFIILYYSLTLTFGDNQGRVACQLASRAFARTELLSQRTKK